MKSVIHCLKQILPAFLMLLGIAGAIPAQAAYRYTVLDYPGAVRTQVFGMTKDGQLVGCGFVDEFGGPGIPFVYNQKKRVFTVLPNVIGAFQTCPLGINKFGVVVGAAGDGINDQGFILDKGAFTLFSHPGYVSTVARGIGSSGLVTGYSIDANGIFAGFIYDPAVGSFIDFLPSSRLTIAQGINSTNQVVGGTFLLADGAFPGSPQGHYGFRRNSGGVISLFSVNGPNTRARGISDKGQITGFVFTGVNFKGFVTSLASGPAFQSLTIPDANLLAVPGAVDTFAQAIDTSGRVAGTWTDGDGHSHGFVATP